MTILLAYDTTGPIPAAHEIVQVGGAFCTDDLHKVYARFGSYVRAQKPENSEDFFLRRLGIEGASMLRENQRYWSTAESVWSHFSDLISQYSNADDLEDVRIVVFDASRAREFLRQSLSYADQYNPEVINYAGGLIQTTADYSAFLAHEGRDINLHQKFREEDNKYELWRQVLNLYSVNISNLNDAVERASCMRKCYLNLFQRWQSKNESTSKRKGSQRRSKRQGSGSTPVTRRD